MNLLSRIFLVFLLYQTIAFSSTATSPYNEKKETSSSNKQLILHPRMKGHTDNPTSLLPHQMVVQLLTNKWWLPRAHLYYKIGKTKTYYYGLQYEARTVLDNKRAGLYFSSQKNRTMLDRHMVCATDPLYLTLEGEWKEVIPSKNDDYSLVVSYSRHDQHQNPDDNEDEDEEFFIEEKQFQILSIDEKYMVVRIICERLQRHFPGGEIWTARDCQLLHKTWKCQRFHEYEAKVLAEREKKARRRVSRKESI